MVDRHLRLPLGVPGFLSALRSLYIASLYDGASDPDVFPISSFSDLFPHAGQLHHLSIHESKVERDLGAVLANCRILRSLYVLGYDSICKTHAGAPLLGIILDGSVAQKDLEQSLASGLIDSRTVVFVMRGLEEHSLTELVRWAEGLGVRLDIADGAVRRGWAPSSSQREPEFYAFIDWVDKEFERRSGAGGNA